MRLYQDTETYNEEPISNGAHRYAETVELMLLAYAIDDGEAKVWDKTAGEPMPEDYKAAVMNPETIFIAHNSGFDRTVLKKYSKIFADPLRWEDTMVRALMHGLPGGLEMLCSLFHLVGDDGKDSEGKELVQLFCKPHEKWKIRRCTRLTHPEKWAQFKEYARRDVISMRHLDKQIPRRNYTPAEIGLWHLDQKINDRGFAVDMALVEAAITAIDIEQKQLKKSASDQTEGRLSSTTKRDAFLYELLLYQGVNLANAQAATLEKVLDNPDVPEAAKELIRTRLLATTSSTAKYKKLKSCTSSDGRLRGSLQFCGAQRTSRFSGRLFQPQNLPRPTLKDDDIERGIEALKLGCADMFYDSIMPLTSSALRGCIVAPPGKKLVIADLSNIEGRIQAWLAGEKWKLKAFADFDAGIGHDMYALAYGKMFKVSPESVMEDKKRGGNQRNVGKVSELAGGFGGGVGSFVTFATSFGIDLNLLADSAYNTIDLRILEEANGMWEWAVKKKRTLGLPKKTFVVMDSFKRQWREAHPCIAAIWNIIGDGIRIAINKPKTQVKIKDLTIEFTGKWLYIRLPSGRYLSYPGAQVAEDGQISFMGIDQYTKKWTRIKTHGAKVFENCVQAIARDVLLYNMPDVEAALYEIVLSVHDELITEAPDDPAYNADALSALMSINKPWAAGLPLAAAGFESYRYRKG